MKINHHVCLSQPLNECFNASFNQDPGVLSTSSSCLSVCTYLPSLKGAGRHWKKGTGVRESRRSVHAVEEARFRAAEDGGSSFSTAERRTATRTATRTAARTTTTLGQQGIRTAEQLKQSRY